MARSALLPIVVVLVLCTLGARGEYDINVCVPSFNCSQTAQEQSNECVANDRYGFPCLNDKCLIPECGHDVIGPDACAENQLCIDFVCVNVTFLPPNATCTAGNATAMCETPYVCKGGKCVESSQRRGDLCDAEAYPSCPAPLTCSESTNTCVPDSMFGSSMSVTFYSFIINFYAEVLPIGADCTSASCGPNLFCDPTTYTCARYQSHRAECNASCTDDDQCVSGICVSGTCRESWLPVGAPAVDARQCLSGELNDGKCAGIDCTTLNCSDPTPLCLNVGGIYQCAADFCPTYNSYNTWYNGTHCINRSKEGEACESSESCEAGHYCVLNKCRPYEDFEIPVGAECVPPGEDGIYVYCVSDVCNSETRKCEPAPGVGEPCAGSRCAEGLHCNYSAPQPTCEQSVTHKQPCLWTEIGTTTTGVIYSDNCTSGASERCMCLGTETPRCLTHSDEELADYLDSLRPEASYTMPPEYIALMGSYYTCLTEWTPCQTLMSGMGIQYNHQRLGDYVNLLPPQCKTAFAQYLCCMQCDAGLILFDHLLSDRDAAVEFMNRTLLWDASTAKAFTLESADIELTCSPTPQITVNAPTCDSYDPAHLITNIETHIPQLCSSQWEKMRSPGSALLTLTLTLNGSAAQLADLFNALPSQFGVETMGMNATVEVLGNNTYALTLNFTSSKVYSAFGWARYFRFAFGASVADANSLFAGSNLTVELHHVSEVQLSFPDEPVSAASPASEAPVTSSSVTNSPDSPVPEGAASPAVDAPSAGVTPPSPSTGATPTTQTTGPAPGPDEVDGAHHVVASALAALVALLAAL